MPLNIAINCVPSRARAIRVRGLRVDRDEALHQRRADARHQAACRQHGYRRRRSHHRLCCRQHGDLAQHQPALSMRSPSGTKNRMPTIMPPNDNVGIQPVAAASA